MINNSKTAFTLIELSMLLDGRAMAGGAHHGETMPELHVLQPSTRIRKARRTPRSVWSARSLLALWKLHSPSESAGKPPQSIRWRDSERAFNSRASRQAFTVIELAVVLAVLSVLALTLAQGLARTKPGAFTAQCVNNLRQLGFGWRLYAEDNSGRLVYNHDGGNAGKAPGIENWAGGWLDYTSNTDNTNTALLINHDRYLYSAYLGTYVKTARLFKCPADPAMVNMAGKRVSRVRSLSMNSRFGEGARAWLSYTSFRLYRTMQDVVSSTPAQLFVILDEHEASINDAVFFTDPDTPGLMIDYPASYHDGGAGFTFADGHSEIHRWHHRRTMPVLGPGQLLPPINTMPGSVDVLWLQQHSATRN